MIYLFGHYIFRCNSLTIAASNPKDIYSHPLAALKFRPFLKCGNSEYRISNEVHIFYLIFASRRFSVLRTSVLPVPNSVRTRRKRAMQDRINPAINKIRFFSECCKIFATYFLSRHFQQRRIVRAIFTWKYGNSFIFFHYL